MAEDQVEMAWGKESGGLLDGRVESDSLRADNDTAPLYSITKSLGEFGQFFNVVT